MNDTDYAALADRLRALRRGERTELLTKFLDGDTRTLADLEADGGDVTPKSVRHLFPDLDPLRPPETDADLTDVATQAVGWYLSALVLVLLGVIACAGSALYVWARS